MKPADFDLIVELVRDVKLSSSKTVFQGGRFLGEIVNQEGRFRAVYHVVDFQNATIDKTKGADHIRLEEDLFFEPADYQAEFKRRREAGTGQSLNPARNLVSTNVEAL